MNLAHLPPAFRQGLNDAGYGDGRNALSNIVGLRNEYERLTALAAELVPPSSE